MNRTSPIFAIAAATLLVSNCDLYERIRDKGVIDSSSFSVFQSFSGQKCRLEDESGDNELLVDCQKISRFIKAEDKDCQSGKFTPAKAYFPDESLPINLCRDYSYAEFADKERLRVLVFADSGAGQSKTYGYAQIEVAQAMTKVCRMDDETEACDFAIVSGDLIYPSGVESVFDTSFKDRFEEVYADFGDMPLFVVPGNHDYRGNVTAQVEYTYFSDRWRMLDRFFEVPSMPAWINIVGLDTTALLGDEDVEKFISRQREMYKQAPCPVEGWRILFGHHTAFANGKHGTDFEAATEVLSLSESCPLDIYFSGHDHIQEHIHLDAFEQIVQGAGGAKVSNVTDRGDEPYEADERAGGVTLEQRFVDGSHGFAIADITEDQIDVYFFATRVWEFEDGVFKSSPSFDDHTYHCRFTRGDEQGCVPQ